MSPQANCFTRCWARKLVLGPFSSSSSSCLFRFLCCRPPFRSIPESRDHHKPESLHLATLLLHLVSAQNHFRPRILCVCWGLLGWGICCNMGLEISQGWVARACFSLSHLFFVFVSILCEDPNLRPYLMIMVSTYAKAINNFKL